ncbi:MAG: LytTR family transcriptional regulator [Bacteroidia bacterium]|nr:LytTR family transcriptional regulator [Bacteroidia bacterium]
MFWEKLIPEYFTSKRNIRDMILFTAIYALFFINTYNPFGVDYWFTGSQTELFVYSSALILTGVLFVAISRIIMYHYHKRHQLSVGLFALWILIELLIMGMVYAVEIILVLDDPRTFPDIVGVSLQNTALLLIQPYLITLLYISWKDARQNLEQMQQQMEKKSKTSRLVHIKDDNGHLRFSFKPDDLLYLESADNYVKFYYLLNGKLTQEVLRNTMKKMETLLNEFSVIRCHKSYMVNINHVSAIQKDKDGLLLLLDHVEDLRIPVSKTYSPAIIRMFMSRSGG